jgi:hypothetical protein
MNYAQYYSTPSIQTKGFKPVYGATGLGKTYGIKEYIKKVLSENPKQKFIYITNRHALIQELYKDLQGEEYGLKVAYLKGKIDNLKDLQKDNKLEKILSNLVEQDFFKYENESSTDLRNFFSTLIENLVKKENDFKNNPYSSFLEKDIESIYSQLLAKIRKAFLNLKLSNNRLFQSFLKNEALWQLFPFIQFENDENTNVLVGTIQKFCYGFFDGKKYIKLHALQHANKEENYIIFLDEFDFLENEILNIVCKEPQIQNSIEFVGIFMEAFDTFKDDEFWKQNNALLRVYSEMKKTYNYLTDKIEAYGFDFPENRKFTFDNKDFSKGKKHQFVLFQNDNIPLRSESFYLEQSNKSKKFKIVKNRNQNTVNPFVFFGMIKVATERLLRTFDSIKNQGLLIESIIQEFWNTKNDNTKGEYHRYISENFAYRTIKRKNVTNEEFSYNLGFSLMTIKKENLFNPQLATIEQLELITSPEAIITGLASNNLVFALSATTDIPRMVNSFDMSWLKKNTNFIEPSFDDLQLIKDLKEAKQEKRKSDVSYKINRPIQLQHLIGKVIVNLSKIGYYNSSDSEKIAELRIKKALIFFGCIDWIIQSSANRNHLVFLNSFGLELPFFSKKGMPEMVIKKLSKIGFEVSEFELGYQLKYLDKTTNFIFLDANQNRKIGESEESQKRYDKLFLDTTADKVILVTQYKTASNGLNLRCLNPVNGKEVDFEGIHLLEPQHFWFDTDTEKKADALNNKKKAFWYFWKLFKKGELGTHRFEQFLKKTNLKDFNNFYKETHEYILNQIALFHQALGRVDRKREYLPLIEVTLAEDVHNIFVDFLTRPLYQEKEEIVTRNNLTATFILQLNEAIKSTANMENLRAESSTYEDISEEQNQSKEVIRGLLNKIQLINNNNYKEALIVIDTWKQIREYVLKQDTKAKIEVDGKAIINFQDLSFDTNLLKDNKYLYLSVDNFWIYPENFKTEDDIISWDLSNPYYYIVQNKFLKEVFNHLGYPTSFTLQPYSTQTIFTPYIQQAILRGAIGEEAVKCLLERENFYCESDDNIPFSLFELFDAKLKEYPIYIDFKNFSKKTQELFSIPKDDFMYEEDFDSEKFLLRVQRKLQKIRAVSEDKNAKYVVINFVSDEHINSKYFDINLKQVDYFNDSDIVVVPGTITKDNLNETSKSFDKFIQSLNNLKR